MDELLDGNNILKAENFLHVCFQLVEIGIFSLYELELLIFMRIPDIIFHHKPVNLGFSQRIGADLLNGVLGSQHHEGIGYRIAQAFDGYFLFLHRLQQCGLNLRRRAVYFVSEKNVAENGPK